MKKPPISQIKPQLLKPKFANADQEIRKTEVPKYQPSLAKNLSSTIDSSMNVPVSIFKPPLSFAI